MLARLTHRVLNPRGLSQLLPVDGELLSVVDENWFIGRSDLGMLALVTVWPQKDPRTARGGKEQQTSSLHIPNLNSSFVSSGRCEGENDRGLRDLDS